MSLNTEQSQLLTSIKETANKMISDSSLLSVEDKAKLVETLSPANDLGVTFSAVNSRPPESSIYSNHH